MELGQFIGKIVISTSTNKRYRLHRITSPYIDVESEQPNSSGYHSHYRFNCINDDPISNGNLVFEDQSLTEFEGKRGHNTVINSLRRFSEFVNP